MPELTDQPIAQKHLKDGRAYSAIIFDMDGLMLDTELIERQVWQQAAKEFNYSISHEEFAQLVGRTEPSVKKILTNIWIKRNEDPKYFDDVLKLKKSYYQDFIYHNKIPIKEGLLDLLSWIKEVKLFKAVASSSKRQLVIERLTLANLSPDDFDVIVGGDEVNRGKPAPDIFLLAAQR
ncbi:MAG: HAD family phosphatase [Chloroflexota bacterium]